MGIGPAFRALEAAWIEGVAAMARAGLEVLWVGVRCDSAVAAARETARGDRLPGMAVIQAGSVHRGVSYDLEVDTTHTGSLACARTIAAHAT